jgi:hypothetical protein
MLWSSPATWAGNTVPGDGNAVAITAGDTVIMDYDMSAYVTGLNGLVIHGTLTFPTTTPVGGTSLVPQSLNPTLAIKNSTTISGEGTLLIGNSEIDAISIVPLGKAYRARILCLGAAPVTGLITVNACSMFGWYDLVNSTQLTQPAYTGTTTIQLVDNMMLQVGDVIVIGAAQTQGAWEGAAMGRFTVTAYNSTTKTITFTPGLGSDRLAGDPVAHVSRPIRIETTQGIGTGSAPVFATTIGPFDYLEGVWIVGGCHIADTISEDLVLTAVTVENNYLPSLFACSGDVYVEKSTFLNANTDTASGALVDNMSGTSFIESTSILGAEVGISNCAGTQAKNLLVQNMSTACLSEMRSSIFNLCTLAGSALGSYDGGHNTYINCVLDNNIVDFDSEYEAACYRLTLGNPLSLGLPVGSTKKLWYTNKSFDHGQVQSEHMTWCVGGYGFLQDIEDYAGLPTWQFVVQRENVPIYWDTPFLGVEGKPISISVAMKKGFSGGTVKFQIIDPALDPLYGFGDSALTEIELPEEINHWRILGLTYIPQATQPYIARVYMENTSASGMIYAQLQGLNAAKITGGENAI